MGLITTQDFCMVFEDTEIHTYMLFLLHLVKSQCAGKLEQILTVFTFTVKLSWKQGKQNNTAQPVKELPLLPSRTTLLEYTERSFFCFLHHRIPVFQNAKPILNTSLKSLHHTTHSHRSPDSNQNQFKL